MGNKFKKNTDVTCQKVEGQAVLIHNRLGEIQVLNEVGSLIWENLEKGSDEIVETICKEYDVTKEEAKKDVEDFLKELKENQAITEE